MTDLVQPSSLVSTDIFIGSVHRPRQVLWVTTRNVGPTMLRAGQPATVSVEGVGVTTPEPSVVRYLEQGAEHTIDVAVDVDPSYLPGASVGVRVVTETPEGRTYLDAEMVVGEPGWTMFLVPHFHYDPVWWNTQAGFTATWYDLPVAEGRRPPEVRTAFDLVRGHLDAARCDPDYKFVLAELDYLKPHWDAFPEDRADLRQLLAEGRVEIVGGNYNEPNTNLTATESTIRNAVYGIGFQRDVVGGDPRTAWMLDVFGHDPAYPGLMADAGLTSSSWARGPFHQWGPKQTVGDNRRMQFPSEFEWVSPNGAGLLTSYMPNHYGAGWGLSMLPTLGDAEAEAYRQFEDLKVAAATRNALLPVGADHVIPSRWATEIHRDWNKRYVWPRFVVALPREFFAAVRAAADESGTAFTPQSRDMNPVYTGKDVSYIDTKQAQRAAETAVLDAERLATLAGLMGTADGPARTVGYPTEALDKAWRQLLFGAHHDAITGTESDQVYLDLLGGWREAYELGDSVRRVAIDQIGARVDTRGEGTPILVTNTLSWPRSDVTSVALTFPASVARSVEVRDDVGGTVPAVIEGRRTRDDGSLAEVTVAFVAHDVPAMGYRTYRVVPVAAEGPWCGGWSRREGGADGSASENMIENACFRIEADPARGGALARILDKRAGKEIVRSGEVAGELVVHDEHPKHPDFAEGPWHLLPTGTQRGSASLPADVRVETSPAARRIVSAWSLDDLRVTQETTLWGDSDRIDFRTHVDGSIGHDRLLRARFPVDVGGGRPVYEVGNAVVGRTFGLPDVDAARTPWTYDNPSYTWVGLSSAARVALRDSEDGAIRLRHAIGVGEVVAPDPGDPAVRGLVAALAAQGVTTTCTTPAGPRYGASDLDSNLPDVRIALGGPDDNPFTGAVLEQADPAFGDWLRARLAGAGGARLWLPARRTRTDTWTPGADLRGVLDLPVLVVAGADLTRETAAVAADLADATVEVTQPSELGDGSEPLEDYSVALLNRGTPGCLVDKSGTVHLSLMRSCSGWPAGVWIDPPTRTLPDGSSFAWQHWSHTFVYSLVAGPGDWRDTGFVHHGHELNYEPLATEVGLHAGELPPAASLFEVEPRRVVLTALKPRGNPLASGRAGDLSPTDGITVRCYEAHGRPVEARLRALLPLRDAEPTDLLEAPRGGNGQVADVDGSLHVRLAATGTATVAAVPELPPTTAASRLGKVAPRSTGEPAQPVYTRYWLHNKGPAPYGYVPVSVYASPETLRDGGRTRVTVASSATDGPRFGRVELDVPVGFAVAGGDDLTYRLEPGEHTVFDLDVRPGEVLPGRYFLAARIRDDHGQTLEDVVAVDVGGEAAPYGEPELAVDLENPLVRLSPGATGTVSIRLEDRCRSEIRGEAQLVSPYGTWEALGPWTQGFAVGAGEATTLRYDVRIPVAARPGEYWAVVKVMYHGRLHYTQTIHIEVTPPST